MSGSVGRMGIPSYSQSPPPCRHRDSDIGICNPLGIKGLKSPDVRNLQNTRTGGLCQRHSVKAAASHELIVLFLSLFEAV